MSYSTDVKSTGQVQARVHSDCRMLFVEDTTVSVKYRTAITLLFLYINLCLSVMLDSLSISFSSKSFLTNCTV